MTLRQQSKYVTCCQNSDNPETSIFLGRYSVSKNLPKVPLLQILLDDKSQFLTRSTYFEKKKTLKHPILRVYYH
jgi:hypothetical protein